jgi:hypothetical protein
MGHKIRMHKEKKNTKETLNRKLIISSKSVTKSLKKK